nr:2'-5' RNA ligase family protein [Streptomyces sp. SID13666]
MVATVQFNLRTTQGRDAYEQVLQWHEHGQAQFSIGYKVPLAGASKRADGVRMIHRLDLYEVSPVLHGAHPLTRSLEVKAAPEAAGMEHKTTWSSVDLEVKTAESNVDNGVMVALYPARDIAARIAHPDGTPPAELHITLAYLGDADQLPGHPDDLPDLVRAAITNSEPLQGSIGGIGRFPDTGSGVPTWIPIDVPGLTALRERVADALAASPLSEAVRTDHGFTPHLTLGYDLPDVADVPAIPLQFNTVHVVRGHDRIPIRLTGPPADTEIAPAQTPPPEPYAVEAKSAAALVAEAKALRPAAASARAVVTEAKSRFPAVSPEEAPVTPYQPLSESYEQIRSRITAAARELLQGNEEDSFTCVEATYPDHVIVCVRDGPGDEMTYSVPYRLEGRDVALGTPQEVELTTFVIPAQDGEPERAATDEEDLDARVVQPSVESIGDAAARINLSDARAEELEKIRPTVISLLSALSAKGLDIEPDPDPQQASLGLWDDEDDLLDDEGINPESPYDEVDADDDPDEDAGPQPKGSVRLDAAEVKAQLAALHPA